MTKEAILQKVQQLAAANGGKTPGMAKFHKETGVTYYDWFGKYWARWSDLLQDAGLKPNKMQMAIDDDFLIEKLIGLIREIGRFPVKGDFLLKKYQNKEFPNVKTFNRLGSKRNLISKVLSYCDGNQENRDILEICKVALPEADPEEEFQEQESRLTEDLGLIYLIKSGRFYKIGKTNSIGRRVYELAIQLAEKPSTIHIIKTDDPKGVESYWHQRFEGKRKGGEWFDLESADIKAFKRWIRIA